MADEPKIQSKATIKDIARLVGVSETTVSLSFRPNSRIGKKTRNKVLEIANELNYFPNTAARDLRSGRTRTIGIIINDITNPFYGAMIRKAEEIASQQDYEVIIAESQWSSERSLNSIRKMIQNRFEGIIICFTEKTRDTYELIQSSGLAHIAVDTIPPFYNGPYVINDAQRAGYLAAQHLHERGCSKIAVFNAQNDIGEFSSVKSMEEGFFSFYRESGFPLENIDRINAGLTISSGEKAFQNVWEQGTFHNGIFCMNDFCAMGVMNESALHDILPGRDYAIIGVDNNYVSSLHCLSLSSIDIAYTEISEIATTYLINRIEKRESSTLNKIIPPLLVARDSTLNYSAKGKVP